MAMEERRFSGLSRLAAKTGNLPNPRQALYAKLVREVTEITGQVAALEELRQPKTVSSKADVIANLEERNRLLKNILANLDDKAKAIAREYADFFEEISHERAAALEESQAKEDMIATIEFELGREVAAKSRSLTDLKEKVVAETSVRAEVNRLSELALVESQRLREANEDLTKRLAYRGPPLSEGIEAFLEDRKSRFVSAKLIADLRIKLNLFIALIGDKPVGKYVVSDLQRFAVRLSYLPQRHKVKPGLKSVETEHLIKQHEGGRQPGVDYLTENTIRNNFVGRVKTAIRWICAEHAVDYPFRENISIIVPAARSSVIRHGFSREQVNLLLSSAAARKLPDEAWLPFVGLMTGARISELVAMRPADIQQRDGVWVADLTRQTAETRASYRSLKTQTSRRYLVLHDALVQRGFVDWAKRGSREWVFADFQAAKKPAGAASKRFQRLFREWGMKGENVEVFHALRHTYKDVARAAAMEERTIALQTGHSLAGVAMNYGSKVLRPDEMQKLSSMPVPDGWNFSPYDGLMDRVASLEAGRIQRQRRRAFTLEDVAI